MRTWPDSRRLNLVIHEVQAMIAPHDKAIANHGTAIAALQSELHTTSKELSRSTYAINSDLHYINQEETRIWTALHALESVHPGHTNVTQLTRAVQALTARVTSLEQDMHKPATGVAALSHALAQEQAKIRGIDDVLKGLATELASLKRSIPHGSLLTGAEQTALRDAQQVWSWAKPIVETGAITGALTEAWRLMRDGECPCNGVTLPSIGNPITDALIADQVLKSGI